MTSLLNNNGYNEVSYVSFDEDEGPLDECPAEVFNVLTPICDLSKLVVYGKSEYTDYEYNCKYFYASHITIEFAVYKGCAYIPYANRHPNNLYYIVYLCDTLFKSCLITRYYSKNQDMPFNMPLINCGCFNVTTQILLAKNWNGLLLFYDSKRGFTEETYKYGRNYSFTYFYKGLMYHFNESEQESSFVNCTDSSCNLHKNTLEVAISAAIRKNPHLTNIEIFREVGITEIYPAPCKAEFNINKAPRNLPNMIFRERGIMDQLPFF